MKRSMLMKAKNSFLGRVFRRLLGEEKGAVMMEYIVIGLLIAAVAVVAVGAFGNVATGLFGVMASAMKGSTSDAKDKLGEVDTAYITDSGNSNTHQNTVQKDEDWTKQNVVGTMSR